MLDMGTVKFSQHGLICAIAQDCATGEVLMQAYMNEEALQKTLETGLRPASATAASMSFKSARIYPASSAPEPIACELKSQ